MERGRTPASALSYVRNGGALFEKCLQSGLFCREHIVLDGGSTDGSRELAEKYGCRVLPQDSRFLDSTGCIIDFGGIVNQAYAETQESWVVLISGDEEFGAELIESMIAVIEANEPGAYFINRYFELEGKVIRFASTNPNCQIRLCHKSSVLGFTKVVHERPVLAPGVKPILLAKGFQHIPLTETPAELKQKYHRYLALEEARSLSSFGWLQWFRFTFRRLLIMSLLMTRMLRFRLLHHAKDCLPLRYDLLNVWYSWQLIRRSCPVSRARRAFTASASQA